MNFTFRTDASLDIGTGHVMRCLTLARVLRGAGHDCRFVSRAFPGHMGDRIAGDGFEISLLPAPEGSVSKEGPAHAPWAGVPWTQDARETRAALAGDTPDWLVMDHYAFDARWQKAVRPKGTRLFVIDDLADRPHDGDLLVDQNLVRSADDYASLIPESCQCLIGPQFALLRPEFAAKRAQALADRAGRALRHLLVTMGGVDQADATSTVLKALGGSPLPEGLRITVIMGSAAPALERVRAQAAKMRWPTEVAVDVADMADRMAAADLAIGAAGSTTWERCCLGLPSIIVETADNQAGIARAMVTAGAALDPGQVQAPDFAQTLRTVLAEVSDPARLDAMSDKAASICDGDGVGRVLAALVPSDVSFREAIRADSRRVWEWRGEVDKSLQMVGEDTPYDQHDKWFRRAVNNTDRIIRIAMKGELPCGYLRLDRTNEVCARVSICLSSEVRRQGLGGRLLKEAEGIGGCLGIQRLNAEIHPRNTASRRVFEKAGYVQSNTADGFLTFHRVIEDAT